MLTGRADRPLLALAVLIVLGIGISAYSNWARVRGVLIRDLQARDGLLSTLELITQLNEAETGQRGYLLTGEDEYLVPYQKAVVSIPALLDRVTEAAGSDSELTEDAKLLRRYSQDKLAELAQTVSIRREKGLDAVLQEVHTNRGKAQMDSIRTVGAAMTNREFELLRERRAALTSAAFRAFWVTAAGLAVLLLAMIFLQRTVDRGIQARENLLSDLDQAKQKLEITLMSIGDAVIASDNTGRVSLMNSVAENLTGWKRSEAEGQPVDKIFQIVNEETRIPVESPVSKVLNTGAIAGLANHTVLIGKQGLEIPIDDSGAPIRNERNEVLGVILVFRDISKRREQENQIQKWHKIFQQAGFGVAILIEDGKKILEVNEAFERMHGYGPQELNGVPFENLVAEDESTQLAGDHVVYESVHKRKDGGSFNAITDATVFRDSAGKPLFRAAYFADISDRKQAELNLRRSEERFRAAVEAMGDIIWTNNANGEMMGPQPGWEAFTGQSFEEYQGFGGSKAIHPEDMDLFHAWRRAIADPKKFTAECRVRRRDGQYRLMSTTAVPVFDEGGAVREWVGAMTDITERRRGEEEVRESDRRFQGLATAFPQLVWSSKPDGNLEYANALWKEYAGIPNTSEAEGSFWDGLLHSEDADSHMEHWRESMASGNMFESQVRLRRSSDGTYRWFLCRAVAVRGSGDRIVRWLGACTDINEQVNYANDLRITNQALQHSNADLEQFAYVASHDLQEPLRMISLYTQLLQEEYENALDETARSYVEFAVSGAQRMERLLQDLMAYSRVSAVPQGQIEASDAKLALKAALENLEATVRKTGAQFHVKELPCVAAPSVHLVQLFQNLIGNALKYCGEKVPELWIDAGPEDRFWRFSIRDNGIGIEPQYAKQIFGIFKRLHASEYDGTGIGLAVCQRIVERNGGRIWLESMPGEGSTFYFTLPRPMQEQL